VRPTDETTRELTGNDADMDEAEIGSAGNGTDPYGADLTGGFPQPIEDEPDEQDIAPDRIERFPGAAPEDEDGVTARPTDHEEEVDPAELP
jgi:hypothetical protein